MTQPQTTSARRGFALLSPEARKAVAARGGRSVPNDKRSFSADRSLAAEAGRKGGQNSSGNFAVNRERAVEAGRKGGSRSRVR